MACERKSKQCCCLGHSVPENYDVVNSYLVAVYILVQDFHLSIMILMIDYIIQTHTTFLILLLK